MHKKNKNYWTFMLKCTNIELTVKRNKKQEGNKRMKGNTLPWRRLNTLRDAGLNESQSNTNEDEFEQAEFAEEQSSFI